MRKSALASSLLAASWLLGAAAFAATLTGTVSAPDGHPLPGAQVSVTAPDGARRATATDRAGAFAFTGLPQGDGYRVLASMGGFAAVEQSGIVLAHADDVVAVEIRLVPAITERVETTARADAVALEDTTTSTSFDAAFIANLPILGRNYQDILALAPGVTDTDGDGHPNVHGSRERSFQTQLGDINVGDPFTGRGTDFDINIEAIDEVEIVTSGASAEFTRGEGFARIITKSGSNEFSGTFKLFYRSDLLDGDGAGFDQTIPNFDEVVPDDEVEFTNYFPFLSFGGAIVRDRLWYFTAHRFDHLEFPDNVGTDVQIRKVDFLQEIGKLTWQIHPRHKLAAEIVYNPQQLRNFSPAFGFSTGVARESLIDQDDDQQVYSLRHSAVLGPSLLLESTLALLRFSQDVRPVREPRTPDEPLQINTVTGTFTGPFNETSSDHRERLTWKQTLSWYVDDFLGTGSHDLRFGGSVEDESFSEQLDVRPTEVLLFNPFELPNPNEPPESFQPSFVVRNESRPGLQRRRARGDNYGLFVQDHWKPTPNLSIGLGLRFDVERVRAPGRTFFEPLAERLAVDPDLDPATAPIAFDDGDLAAFTRHPLDDDFLRVGGNDCDGPVATPGCPRILGPDRIELTSAHFSPRVSLSWDPLADGRTKLFATYGRYYDKIFLQAVVLEQGPDEFPVFIEFTPDGEEVVDTSAKTPPTVHQVDRRLSTPFVDEITLGFERELLPELVMSLTYVARNGRDQLQDVDVNHRNLGTDELGELVELPGQFGFGRSTFAEVPDGLPDLAINSFYFNQVFRVGNFNRSRYRAIELELVKRLHRNWQLQGSYTWSRARGDAEDFLQLLGDDPAAVDDEPGYLDFDQRHVVKASFVSFLPRGLQLGGTVLWESGLPYSVVVRDESLDDTGYSQFRQAFPTGQRNDRRNRGRWTFDVSLKQLFQIGRVAATASVEVSNLLNSDDLQVFLVENDPDEGEDVVRREYRFGRRWQVGLEFHF